MNSLDKRIAQVCRDTPDIQVLDNRSLTVQELQRHRAAPDEVIDAGSVAKFGLLVSP